MRQEEKWLFSILVVCSFSLHCVNAGESIVIDTLSSTAADGGGGAGGDEATTTSANAGGAGGGDTKSSQGEGGDGGDHGSTTTTSTSTTSTTTSSTTSSSSNTGTGTGTETSTGSGKKYIVKLDLTVGQSADHIFCEGGFVPAGNYAPDKDIGEWDQGWGALQGCDVKNGTHLVCTVEVPVESDFRFQCTVQRGNSYYNAVLNPNPPPGTEALVQGATDPSGSKLEVFVKDLPAVVHQVVNWYGEPWHNGQVNQTGT